MNLGDDTHMNDYGLRGQFKALRIRRMVRRPDEMEIVFHDSNAHIYMDYGWVARHTPSCHDYLCSLDGDFFTLSYSRFHTLFKRLESVGDG